MAARVPICEANRRRTKEPLEGVRLYQAGTPPQTKITEGSIVAQESNSYDGATDVRVAVKLTLFVREDR